MKKRTETERDILRVAAVCPNQEWTVGKMVAGLMLLMHARHPQMTPQQIRAVLERRAMEEGHDGVEGFSHEELIEVVYLFAAAGLVWITGVHGDDVAFKAREDAPERLKAILEVEE